METSRQAKQQNYTLFREFAIFSRQDQAKLQNDIKFCESIQTFGIKPSRQTTRTFHDYYQIFPDQI